MFIIASTVRKDRILFLYTFFFCACTIFLLCIKAPGQKESVLCNHVSLMSIRMTLIVNSQCLPIEINIIHTDLRNRHTDFVSFPMPKGSLDSSKLVITLYYL